MSWTRMRWFAILLLVKTVLGALHNPDENFGINNSSLFEGDMILSKKQQERAEEEFDIDSSRRKRAATSAKYRLWPKGIVTYVIDSSLGRYSSAMAAIKAGMEEWTKKTCIQFKKRTSTKEVAYVVFRSGSGCASYVGRIGRRQDIYLAPGCWFKGVVAHEIGHAIGFYHEQSRTDRDSFIIVKYENISPGTERNFYKYGKSLIDSLRIKYDYGSLMHYSSTAFSKNGKPTIVVIKKGVSIGQRVGLSSIDAQQANLMYKAQCARRGGKGGANCKDSSRRCRSWSWRRRCKRSKYVRSRCKKTCKVC